MSVEERIEKIHPYFSEMKIVNGEDDSRFICISCRFPEKWKLTPDVTKEKFGADCEKESGTSLFWCPISTGFDAIFDAIDYNINVNELAQERIALFKTKINELKELFNDNDITVEMLRTLTFSWKGKKKKTVSKNGTEPANELDNICNENDIEGSGNNPTEE